MDCVSEEGEGEGRRKGGGRGRERACLAGSGSGGDTERAVKAQEVKPLDWADYKGVIDPALLAL